MMEVVRLGQVCCPTGRRWVAVVAAVLAACGVAGAAPSAALAGSPPKLDWTKQHPATSPSARDSAAMAYDAATRTVVLFGGATDTLHVSEFRSTWAWG